MIMGMQANMFSIILRNSSEELKLMGKRIRPKELPPKANIKIWRSFLASVEREVIFYSKIKNESAISNLFPKCYFTDSAKFA